MSVLALIVFGWDLAAEPHFMDESAMLSQSFFADLAIAGDFANPLWLSYGGYDHPPLPKYLIGLALRVAGYPRPHPSAMWAWFAEPSRQFVPLKALVAARCPSVVFGAFGVLAIYALGTLAIDRRAGLVAALLLTANPLYRMHARRAMSDTPTEALILMTLVIGLWGWKRLLSARGMAVSFAAVALGSGVLAGVATLSKLNGALAMIVLVCWALLALILSSSPIRGRAAFAGAAVLAGLVAFSTFVALDPFLYCHPRGPIDPRLGNIARMNFTERVGHIVRHRVEVSAQSNLDFPRDALVTPLERSKAMLVQGFGRFGPLGPRGRTDSTIRYDRSQDWGAALWLPWVALGLVVAFGRGRAQIREGRPPAAWAVVVQALVALAVVGTLNPIAWDRYFLPIQAGAALLGSFAAVGILDGIGRLGGRG